MVQDTTHSSGTAEYAKTFGRARVAGVSGRILVLLAVSWGVVGAIILLSPLTLHNAFVSLNLRMGSFRYFFPEDQSTVLRALASAGAWSSAALLFLSAFRRPGAQSVRALALGTRVAAVFVWLVVWMERPGLTGCTALIVFELVVASLLAVSLRGGRSDRIRT